MAAEGNQNAKKGANFKMAIRRALARTHGSVSEGLIQIGLAMVRKASEGDMTAAKEIADRLDGKPVQTVNANVSQTVVSIENANALSERLAAALAKRSESPTDIVH